MITVERVNLSIQRALEGQSNLSQGQIGARGFSTPAMRRLVNNLCQGVDLYLEIGLYCGATFCSSFNKSTTSIGIEDHSQDFSAGFETVKKELQENINSFLDRAKEVKVHYEDCFKMDKTVLPDNIQIYYFDGEHSEESQAKALPHFIDKMADTFLFIVDDWAWPSVFNGTNKGFQEISEKIEIAYHWPLRGYSLQDDPIWHNSVGLFLINKK
jgi:hypothetical protein